ncbi:MAG: hypothetical protein ALECFALPRED_006160 [Alectoria fallacina]|uniref:Uncharacterized protein n=1 Tax=Alectoria fallacina TaxID=1903189 RepID=A0A8H3FYV6_9LECA|nr:MAG: hypothetical protein ALECFALPRED_006160 [Alectoria fallacina]
MSPSPYFALFPLYPDFAISLVLNSLQNTNELITLSEPTSLIPSNASVIIDNFTIKDTANLTSSTHLSIPKIDCDDERFGTPSVASCKDAIAEIPQDPATIIRDPNRSYGPRGEGTWDVNLPKRYISSDGQCIIDLTQTSTPSHGADKALIWPKKPISNSPYNPTVHLL